ncbi:MAG: redoxin domain-containing protein [Actinomycetota bacterium]
MVRILKIVFLVGFLVLGGLAQSNTPKFEKELSEANQAFDSKRYDEALKHFKKAEKFESGHCRECLVGMLRSHMYMGDLKNALKEADQAMAISLNGKQQGEVQVYRGVIFSRMQRNPRNLSDAEAAFRSAIAANADCSECKVDLGMTLLREGKDHEGVQVLKAVLPEYKGSLQQKEIGRFIADPGRARQNFAPEFSAKTSSGQAINLDTLQGKVVLLDFWGTWCPPCRDSVPVLKELVAKNDPSKVIVVSIDEGDSSEKWAQFVQKNGMTWPQVYDEDRSLKRAFAVHSFPHYFLLNKDGIILQTFDGWSHGELFTLKKAIESALK